MKKIFSLMLMLAFALFAGVSCTNDQTGDENPPVTPDAPVVTVTGVPEDVLTPEAGSFTLNYTIENATMTGVLNVTTEATWLTKGEDTGAAVTFAYSANTDAPGTPAREAVITFAYEGAEAVAVTVKQDSQAASFTLSVNEATLTCGNVDYAITPVDNEMLYLVASSQDLGNFGIQGETPAELMQNYVNLLVENWMIMTEPDFWFVYKGDMVAAEGWKQASRYNAEDEVTIYAVGFNITTSESDSSGTYATAVEFSTAIHAWEAPFLPYPTVTVPEEQLVNNVSAAAGELVLDCVLENALSDGSEVTFDTEATWVHPTWADNKLTIAYDANETAVARRAKIAVQYGWWTNPFEVTVIQEKNSDATAITLNITVKETHFNGILVDVVPSDANVTYALGTESVDKDENDAEVAKDWMSVSESLLSYVGSQTFHKGNLTNYFIKTNPNSYQWDGYDYYVYAVAVDATSEETTDYFGNPKTEWTVKQILSEVSSVKTTIDVSDMPELTWNVEKSGLVWNENANRYDIEVVEGSTVVLYFNVENPVEGAAVKTNGATLYDNYNVVDGEPVIDNAAGTVTFKIDKFDTAKSYHYVSVSFKYTNADDDMWSISTPNVRITQTENPGMALPYEESFQNGIGNFTINDVELDGLSYVWKHDSTYKCMKASAFVGGAKATESWLVSPKIDLTSATAPALTFEHAVNYANGTAVEALTLWVKEYGAADWTQLSIPTHATSDSWTFFSAGNVNLAAYVGKKIQIGFKYTSTAAGASTWEVKNVVVYDAGGAVAPLM